jgi:hypothetical protein
MSGFFISRHLVYCIVQIYFLKSSICFQEKCIFAMFCSVLISGSAKSRMKRESGESPGQSRCCKLLCKGLFTTSGHCFLLFEKVGRHNKPE